MTATVQSAQDTAALPLPTGPLTVPIQIIRAAGARHRDARDRGVFTLPAWALLTATAVFTAAIAFALVEWLPAASPLLIAVALVGLAAAYTPDVLAALPRRAHRA